MQIERFAKITAGLAAAGAAAGSVVGFGFAMCLTVLSFLTGTGPESILFLLMAIAALTTAGSVAGATLGPVAAWLLMRHVPLGRAVAGTALGAILATVAGSVLGIVAGWGDNGLLIYPLLGFGASTTYLSVSTPREPRRLGAGTGRFLPGR